MVESTALIWILAIASVILISLVSVIGIFSLLLFKRWKGKFLIFVVSFAAGSLFGGAFLHLLPQAAEKLNSGVELGMYTILGILFFFFLEKYIQWRHCHIPTTHNHPHPVAIMNLVGDGLHNFIDGLIIGVTYLVSIPLGISTSLAVLIHEIPQEIGDFAILLHAGYSRKKALFFNFMIALTALLGAVIGLLIGNVSEYFTIIILPFTAGGFIYIAGSDLIPELHKQCTLPATLPQMAGIVLGIVVMTGLLFVG